MMAPTAQTASGFHGTKLYQERARLALPILIRQAKAGQTISYEDLAAELDMANPRNLNFPLGCIGEELNHLGTAWGSEIPHIQAMVVSKGTSVPGEGFDFFLESRGKVWNSPTERKALLKTYIAEIANYPHWDRVLNDLGLKPTSSKIEDILQTTASFGGGEGPEHKALKEFVRLHPECVGLSVGTAEGLVEAPLPSGDSIDVLFHRPSRIVAVEVKPTKAPLHDITRGLFQCVKYRAVLQALADFEGDSRKIDAFLVLGGLFPKELFPLKNSLGVVVFEQVGS
jgi:hypothetical protein